MNLLDHGSRPYWTVDGKRYYNQFETWMAIGIGDPNRAQFHFYDTAYDSLDWTQEPRDSWDQLVLQRCLQLRNKYQHLCLLYSAGRDSHHILRSFARYKIPLDEIIINDFTLNALKHKEVDSWMIPLAQQYVRDHNPNCRITRITVGKDDYEKFFHETWTEGRCLSGLRGQFQPGNHAWLVEQHLRYFASGTGVVMGVDKPKLYLENGWIQSAFYDIFFDWFQFENSSFEFFYLSPDLPELHLKQCHMIINWWEQNMPGIDAETIFKFINDSMGGHYDDYNLACGRGPAVDLGFQGQNGRNKYVGSNHAAFQLVQRQARNNNWSSLHNWNNSYAWIRTQAPQAFDTENYFGIESHDSKSIKSIASKARRLRPWTVNKQLSEEKL